MKVAYITSNKPGETDRLLCNIAATLLSQQKKLSGIIKESAYQSSYANGCDMKVKVLPDGPVIKITQDLGAGSDACRLDPGALAEAVSRVESTPLDETDLFILNKFGPEESAGHGFCHVIGTALDLGVPVLVGVSTTNVENFESFASGLAERLPADEVAISDWVNAAIAE